MYEHLKESVFDTAKEGYRGQKKNIKGIIFRRLGVHDKGKEKIIYEMVIG